MCEMRREVSTKREMAPVVDPFLFLPVGEGIPAGLDKTWRRLFVRNLPLDIVSAELFDHFSRFGDILEAVVLADQISKVSKGCGVVVFKHERDASLAMNTDSYIDGRKLNKQWGFKGEMVRRAKFNVVNGGSAYMRQTRFSVVRTANIQAIDAVDIQDFRSVFPSLDATDYVSFEINEDSIMQMAKEKARKRLAAQQELQSQRRRRQGRHHHSHHQSNHHYNHHHRRRHHHRNHQQNYYYNNHHHNRSRFGSSSSSGSGSSISHSSGSDGVRSDDNHSTGGGSSDGSSSSITLSGFGSSSKTGSPSHSGLAEPTIGLTKFPNRTVENDFKRALKRAGHLSYQRASVNTSSSTNNTSTTTNGSNDLNKQSNSKLMNNTNNINNNSGDEWWKTTDEVTMKSRRSSHGHSGKLKSLGRFKPAKPPRFRSNMSSLPLSRLASMSETDLSKVSSIFVVPSVTAADQSSQSPSHHHHRPTHHVHQLVTPRSGLSHSVVHYDSNGKASRIVDVRLVKPTTVTAPVCQSTSQEGSLVASPMSSPISTTMSSSDGSPVSHPPPTLSEYLGHPMYAHSKQIQAMAPHAVPTGPPVSCYGGYM